MSRTCPREFARRVSKFAKLGDMRFIETNDLSLYICRPWRGLDFL